MSVSFPTTSIPTIGRGRPSTVRAARKSREGLPREGAIRRRRWEAVSRSLVVVTSYLRNVARALGYTPADRTIVVASRRFCCDRRTFLNELYEGSAASVWVPASMKPHSAELFHQVSARLSESRWASVSQVRQTAALLEKTRCTESRLQQRLRRPLPSSLSTFSCFPYL
jgi:hypothetical protein